MHQDYAMLAKKVIDTLCATHTGGGENDHLTLDTWEWPQGVAIYAMLKVYRHTKDRDTLDFVIRWYENHLKAGLPAHNVNTTAPMLGLAVLYEITEDARYLAPIGEWARWVMEDMPRTKEQGLQHITTHSENVQQLWDDTLYMTVLFLYKAGRVLKEDTYCQEAKYQFLLHIKYLHSTENALWYHGFTFHGRHHFANAYWARGNSWFTCGAIDFLEMIEDDCAARLIRETWQAQCAALAGLQDEDTGLWHTLLDHKESYLETSASAAIAYGLLKGIRLKLLPAAMTETAERAVRGVLAQIGENGMVGGVSYGTPMGDTLDFYKAIPICPTAYGQGLTFLMLTEKIPAAD